MEVHFYLPEKYLPDSAMQEVWKSGKITTLEQGGKIASAQSWIYQTWLSLTQRGVNTHLVHTPPEHGVMITLAGFLGDSFRPAREVYFVDIVADYVPHPGAHLHIVQNSVHAGKLWNSHFMPHWPQPNLLGRDPTRGDRFESLGFFGDAANLAPELREESWQKKLRDDLGLTLAVRGATEWSDYRKMDVILGVRGFGTSAFLHKPATKLYNAWLAGVPFVASPDSAYLGDGRPGQDFLVATDRDELDIQLKKLKESPALRSSLAEEGFRSAQEFSRLAVADRWTAFVTRDVIGKAREWFAKSGPTRQALSLAQQASVWMDRRFRR